jgi:hypothetical protein
MRVTIHQPEHLPWLGLLSKVAAADLWIVLDDVPFRKNYFQNRNRIRRSQAYAAWLTVPTKAPLGTLINDMGIAQVEQWQLQYMGRVDSLLDRGGSRELRNELASILESFPVGASLRDLNMMTAEWLMGYFDVRTHWQYSSGLSVTGRKSDLILNLCIAVGADTYLAGPSGRDYLKLEDFRAAGIKVQFFDFVHPVYRQGFADDFLPGMSAAEPLILRLENLDALISEFSISEV